MHIITLTAFEEELEKIAASSATIGAGIGAGLALLHGAAQEIDHRAKEDRELQAMAPELQPEAARFIQNARRDRAKTVAARTALLGAAGSALGYGSRKLYKKVLNDSVSKFRTGLQTPMGENAKTIGENIAEGFKSNITPKTGVLGWMFRKKPVP